MHLGDTRLIIETAGRYGALRNQLAYILATAYHETAHTMEPVREALADTDEQAAARLERAWTRGRLPWVSKPYWRDGYFGRGYVQLTHEYNYARAGGEIGVDLTADPSKALEPQIAADILVRGMLQGWFTGKRLSDYVTLSRSDYVGARRIVNGTDRARAIAEHARDYEAALIADGYGVEKSPPVVNERRDGTAPRTSPVQSTTNLSVIGAGLSVVGTLSEQAKGAVGAVSEAFGVSPEVAMIAVACAFLAYIFRERLRKWAEGDR